MGREVALWLEEYLGEEGFRLFYMSPHHKPRELLADGEWRDLCSEGEVVKHYCTKSSTLSHEFCLLCFRVCILFVCLHFLQKRASCREDRNGFFPRDAATSYPGISC